MSCLHDPIIDSHSGEEVCCLCGLVINTGMSYEEIIHGDNCYDIHLENKSTPFLFELAAEFISRMHLPQEIVNIVLTRYEKCIKKQSDIIKYFSNQELISYSLYQVLKEMSIPRSLKQIVSVSGVNSRAIWKLEDIFTKERMQLKPIDIILSHYTMLDHLKYEDIRFMRIMCDDLGFLNYNPSTVASFVIYKYLMLNEKKQSMNKICDLVGVNTKSLMRLSNYVKKNIITFVPEKYKNNRHVQPTI